MSRIWVTLDGAGFGYAAHVVASQVEQHDVFGAFFFVVAEFFFEGEVFGFVLASPPGSGYGMDGHRSVNHLHEKFGRRAD